MQSVRNQQDAIAAYVESHQAETLELLARLCAQPSLSTQGTGIEEMVSLLAEELRLRGFSVDVIPTSGNAVILAEHEGRAEQTLLFYNHYDVQPADPLDEWRYPPFAPTVHDGAFYARGAMDDKGHIVCRLAAIDAIKDVFGELPCTVKMIIEGEEEIGSPNLPSFVAEHADWLRSDACLWEFGDVDYDGTSLQYLGFRGLLYVELSIETAETDSHSGVTGTIFPNAAWRLTWALASLKDRNERILIPGFYDEVVLPSAADLRLLDQLPDVVQHYRETYGVREMLNSMGDGMELRQAAVFSPSCTVCGVTAGYQGPGLKTVVPSTASAKVDFRLVPNQTPEDIMRKLREHLDAAGFDDVRIAILGSERPSRTSVDHPIVSRVVESAREIYGKPQRILPMCGGSGPAYLFTDILGMPVVTVGIGHPGSQIHAPNENIRLVDLHNGICHTAQVIAGFADDL